MTPIGVERPHPLRRGGPERGVGVERRQFGPERGVGVERPHPLRSGGLERGVGVARPHPLRSLRPLFWRPWHYRVPVGDNRIGMKCSSKPISHVSG